MQTAPPLSSRVPNHGANRSLVALALAAALGTAALLPALAQTADTETAGALASERRQYSIDGGAPDVVLNRFALAASGLPADSRTI